MFSENSVLFTWVIANYPLKTWIRCISASQQWLYYLWVGGKRGHFRDGRGGQFWLHGDWAEYSLGILAIEDLCHDLHEF